MDCKVCLSPEEEDNVDLVEWFWAKEDRDKLLPIDITEHILVSPEDKTLHLYKVTPEQSGQYMCQLSGQLTAPYFLTVFNDSEPIHEVQMFNVSNGPQVPWVLEGQEIILDTFWGPWSECSNCDVVGKRMRSGYCIISLLQNSTDQVEDNEETKSIKIKENIDKQELEILRVFKYGIPCRSHILPHVFSNVPQVRDRPSEILTGLCKVACPGDTVFVVRDKEGNVVETANNSAGVFSMSQGPPQPQPDVLRILQYEETDTTITLTCPGNLNTDTPIQWMIAAQRVIPSVLTKESRGRIYVTIMEKIVIKNAKVADSDIYSCWQNKELAGAIRLIVEKSFKLNFNHHMMLCGIAVIVLTFLYVYIKAFMHRKNTKI